MLKNKSLILLLSILCFLNSCEKKTDSEVSDIVINELLPVNSTIVADQDGEYNDWLELYNTSSSDIDISGYYLSDKSSNILKWKIPLGTSVPGKGFLVIWADKDTTQAGLHANFKLSSLGEELFFAKPDGTILDEVVYPGQADELSYSRVPDGTGTFRWQNPTFNLTNGTQK